MNNVCPGEIFSYPTPMVLLHSRTKSEMLMSHFGAYYDHNIWCQMTRAWSQPATSCSTYLFLISHTINLRVQHTVKNLLMDAFLQQLICVTGNLRRSGKGAHAYSCTSAYLSRSWRSQSSRGTKNWQSDPQERRNACIHQFNVFLSINRKCYCKTLACGWTNCWC